MSINLSEEGLMNNLQLIDTHVHGIIVMIKNVIKYNVYTYYISANKTVPFTMCT